LIRWLGLADTLHVLLVDDALDDPELTELAWEEWVDAFSEVPCAALAQLPDDLRALEARVAELIRAAKPAPWPVLGKPGPTTEVRPTEWLELPGFPGFGDRYPELTRMAAGLFVEGGEVRLLDPTSPPEVLDLSTGAREAAMHLDPDHSPVLPLGSNRWLEREAPSGTHSPTGQPIALDPWKRAAWFGHRCRFRWFAPDRDRGFVPWVYNPHDWPCGHGKKLYGFEDNDPLWVHLATDGQALLSVYEHDALLSPGVPLRWEGDGACAWVTHPQPLALLFERDDRTAFPGDPLKAEEDARDRRPVIALGPSSELRYVVGLRGPTYRLLRGSEAAELLGGPAEAWLVFDDHHQEARRGEGRLLAGWDRWVFAQEGSILRRHDLLSDTTVEVGTCDRVITHALAIPGTSNALLVCADPNGPHPQSVRVV